MSLSPDLVIWLMDHGYRQTDIAKEYGVSRQYIHKLAKNGGYISPISTVGENLPWVIDPAFNKNAVYIALRAYGHTRVAGRDAMEPDSVRRADTLIRRLEVFQQVIDYDPDYPPIPGLTNTSGFAYLPRRPEDEDFVVRIRPGVDITPLGDKIWRLPKD